ncbi:MAG: alpha-ketoglutarate-dependent dioxygenase AlkB [Deltaproteobacteria bacterium]|nr:MAG: alpha-ketoglutarate-dependent dioxygenase AlkB [Deltaproteobacteria bacterium]
MEPESCLPYDGKALLFREFVSNNTLDELHRQVVWQEESIQMFGKVHKVPRLTAYYGEVGYKYSGVWHPPAEMPPILQCYLEQLHAVTEFRFNSVLCNYYRDGHDGMGFHRDNEPEMDTSCIASVSLGERRRFRMKHLTTKESVSLMLGRGDLLLMLYCQDHWEHAIPKTKKVCGERVNLTFRRIR